MDIYQTRFIRQRDASELIRYYHLAKTALAGQICGRYERLIWAAKQFNKQHPEVSETGAYKDCDCLTSASWIPLDTSK